VTFLDTPGHEAFTEMRARGAQGADIAILVVAADDGVMPTTREALNHARAANVPIVVAINKVDKNNANPDLVKQQLAELDLIPDDWDGSTLMVPISALNGEGIEDLLEAVLLEAEQYDVLANPEGTPRGIVVEAQVDKYRGTLATLLVMNGTLHVGDTVVAGLSYGRIKAMFDERGDQIDEAGPSTPVKILGLDNPPGPGERFEKVADDKTARNIVEDRAADREAAAAQPAQTASLEEIFAQFRAGQAKKLNLIVKADVQGSLEPIVQSLQDMSGQNEEGIQVNVLASDVGAVTENDIMLATAGDEESEKAIIIAFSTTVSNTAKQQAQQQGVEIRHYDVIYKLLEDVEKALQGMLEPKYRAKMIGRAEIRQLFTISRVGTVAGSYMRDGEARRKAKANIVRDGSRIAEGLDIDALKRFNEDVNEVRQGYEFGVSFVGYNDLQEGDTIEFYTMERVS
jgi:translation initiation factor IF-2